MKKILNVPGRFVSNFRADVDLQELRDANPGCRLLSGRLQNVDLGESVAILEGVFMTDTKIGDFSYVSANSRIFNVKIGRFCSIGPNVQIGLAPHPSRTFVSTYPGFYSNDNEGCPRKFREDKIFDDSIEKTVVMHDVWIGTDVIIPGGIEIGVGAIVAAGSVVIKDVPPYSVVGGNPAKIVKYRFAEPEIEYLLASKWWEWSLEKILENLDSFADIDKFKSISGADQQCR